MTRVETERLPFNSGPDHVFLQVNYACYLKCKMCDRHNWVKDGASSSEVLTTEELDNVFAQLSLMRTQKITLVGTEPVLRPDLPAILDGIGRRQIKPELYTAGIVLTEEIIESILNNRSDVAFSVDGLSARSHNNVRVPDSNFDAFSRTLASIKRLRSQREMRGLSSEHNRITANFTIQRINIADLASAGRAEVDAIGADVIRFSIVHGAGEYSLSAEDIPVIRDFTRRCVSFCGQTKVDLSSEIDYLVSGQLAPEDFTNHALIPSDVIRGVRHVQCHIGNMSTMIDPVGNVRPCLYLANDNGSFLANDRDNYVMGNIRQASMSAIWNGPAYAAFRSSGRFPDLSVGSACLSCEYINDFPASP